jgi:hypothetical protein
VGFGVFGVFVAKLFCKKGKVMDVVTFVVITFLPTKHKGTKSHQNFISGISCFWCVRGEVFCQEGKVMDVTTFVVINFYLT